MDVIKNSLLLLIFLGSFLAFSQDNEYPKDTIHIIFKENEANRKIINWDYQKKSGVYFSIKDKSSKHLSLFYRYSEKSDTLCIEHLEDYHFSDLKEIRIKELEWVNRKYKNSKYKPYSGSKNAVFQTYLIEVISENKFVKYPVIWRNEGSID